MSDCQQNLDLRTCKKCGETDLAGLFRYSTRRKGFVCRAVQQCKLNREGKDET